MGLSAVNAGIAKLIFRFMLLRRAYTKDEIQSLFRETALRRVEIDETPIGLEVRAGR